MVKHKQIKIGKHTYGVDENKLDKLIPYMVSNDIDLFFKKYEELI
jgi:hypothetical protein